MGLTNKKEKQLRQMPIIRNTIRKSKDGKYLIHKVIITTIKPMAYYKAIMDNSVVVEEEDVADTLSEYFDKNKKDVDVKVASNA
jgi:hypothetical protein